MSNIKAKIADRSAVVGIIGLGYVGIPLALAVSEPGFKIVGFDIDEGRINQLNAGQSLIKHISDAQISSLVEKGFEGTTDFSRARECDVLIICVPTPLNSYREPDLSFVEATMESIVDHLRAEQMVILESTTWPGTTREVLLPYVERAGFTVGETFHLVYSPEREDPGNENFQTSTIPKVVGGVTEACCAAAVDFYGTLVETIVPVSSTEAAEMVKLLENIHRSVNIGLVNELKVLTDAMDLDIFEIVDAAKTKPFGFTAYYPGPGIGGHCIPIDPFYLTWKAREYGLHTRFIELAGEINASMPQYVVNKIVRALNKGGKSLQNAKILVLGIAYKRDVDDMRESPSVVVMELLRAWGADISYSDPHVPVFPEMREHSFDLKSVDLTPEKLVQYDAVVLLTDHSAFDYDMLEAHCRLLVDTRGRFRNKKHVWA